MSFVIREALLDDAYSLAEILSYSWISSYKDIIPIQELEYQTNIQRRQEMFETLLATTEANIYISINDNIPCGEIVFCDSRDRDLIDYGEIVSIYLLEEYWGKGFGMKMMSFALRTMQQNNYSSVFLWVFKDNKRAIRFYEKLGFIKDGTEKISIFSNQAVEIRYRLNLF